MDKKILFIAPYPFDEAPSQRFRFEQYLDLLKDNHYLIKEVPFLDFNGWKALYRDGSTLKKIFAIIRAFSRRFLLMFSVYKYDFIFIHREASMIGPPFFEWFMTKVLRKKIIYDFDDAIWLPNYSESNARFQRLKMYRKVNKIMKWANKITVGNEFLKSYAVKFNNNVVVIPTTIDTENVHCLKGNPNQQPVIIGWTGTHTTSKYLQFLLPVLDEMSKTQKFKLRIISNLPPDFEKPYLEFVQWNKEKEISDLAQFNIGIMPMEESEWTLGKCAFKALQYMALEIPAVVSPVGMNKEVIADGISGFLCSNETQWSETLIKLIENQSLREQIGKEGRKVVQEKYSVKQYSNNYLKLFD